MGISPTASQLANIFNAGAIGLVLLLSYLISKHHIRPFFRNWIKGYTFGFILVIMPVFVAFEQASPPVALLEYAFILIQARSFLKTSQELLEQEWPKWLDPLLGAILALSLIPLSMGATPTVAVALPFLPLVFSWVRLGYVFSTKRTIFSKTIGFFWLGLPLMIIGILPLTYPLVPRNLDWICYSLATVLHMMVGVGMIVFLLEEISSEYREKQEHLAKLKNDFISTISHELRSPLVSILGYTNILELQWEGPLSETQLQHIGRIGSSAKRLSRLVEDLLDFSRFEGGTFKLEPRDFDLCTEIEGVIDGLKVKAGTGQLVLESKLPEDAIMIHADSVRIAQVLTNLVENAIKFTPAGGQITVQASEDEQEIRVEVQDSGKKIPTDEAERIFAKFYQLDASNTRRQGGIGLGLSIAKAIVEAHGGRIGLDNTSRHGNTFWFTLPFTP